MKDRTNTGEPTCDSAASWRGAGTVDHQKLVGRLRQRTTDPALLALIFRCIKAGAVSPEGRYEEGLKGVPQGAPLSPLMANVDSP